ncbi:hypothetical protein ACRAJ3_11505 [Rhodococcus pyridinivorans]|uniref:hypothetical protein n=1 Tax=Rhodococcus pyridinivorans TaxID=103816 RepID=UPI003D7F4B7F
MSDKPRTQRYAVTVEVTITQRFECDVDSRAYQAFRELNGSHLGIEEFIDTQISDGEIELPEPDPFDTEYGTIEVVSADPIESGGQA